MPRALLPAVLLALTAFLASPGTASAAGPVLQGGMLRTGLTDHGDDRYSGLDGGGFKVGFEVGSHRWRNEWALNHNVLGGYNSYHSGDHELTLTGFSYQLSFLFWEKGFTPYLGLGVEMGVATLWESGYSGGGYWSDTSDGVYLRPYGVAGLRMQFGFGLGLRAEVTASYLMEFAGIGTNLGISYTW